MASYKIEVVRKGIIVVDDVDSLEDAEAYIENCNPIDEVSWSDFLFCGFAKKVEEDDIAVTEKKYAYEVGPHESKNIIAQPAIGNQFLEECKEVSQKYRKN